MIEELIKQLPTATPFFALVAGFLLGLLHALKSDPIVAVATQNSKLSQKSSLSFFQQILNSWNFLISQYGGYF